jgi:hypothetical protein
VVKVSSTCSVSLQISVMTKLNKGSWSADKILQTSGLWLSGQQKRGKLRRNRARSATELPAFSRPDVIENKLIYTSFFFLTN